MLAKLLVFQRNLSDMVSAKSLPDSSKPDGHVSQIYTDEALQISCMNAVNDTVH